MTEKTVKYEKVVQDLAKNGQESMEVYMKSCGIFMKGVEELTRSQVTFAQGFAEKQMKYVNDALKVKTLNEWSDVQNEVAQNTFKELMDNATTASEKYVKLVTDAFEPLNVQVGKTLKKATESVAA